MASAVATSGELAETAASVAASAAACSFVLMVVAIEYSTTQPMALMMGRAGSAVITATFPRAFPWYRFLKARSTTAILLGDRSETHIQKPAVMDSRLLAEPAIGPATSGRTRWRGPGMTRSKISGAHFLREPRRIAVPGDAAVIE